MRDAEGFAIWSWSAPLRHAFGDVFAPEDTEHTQQFLDRWVLPVLETTQAAPAWGDLAAGQTTLDQLTYEDVRARDLPMLCHFSGTARQTCVFWEPAAGGAGHFIDAYCRGDEFMKRTTLALSLLVLAAACSPPAQEEAKVEDVGFDRTESVLRAAGCFAEASARLVGGWQPVLCRRR